MSVVCVPDRDTFRIARPSPGVTEYANKWEEGEKDIRRDMSRAASIDGDDIERRLFTLFEEHSADNWDAYGAKPVTLGNLLSAIDFCRMLPTSIPRPELGVDPDGGIVLEWYRRRNRVFSVCVEKDNRLTYAGLFDSNRASGTEYFDQELPEAVFVQIRRVLS